MPESLLLSVSKGGKLIDWSPTAEGITAVPFTTFTGVVPLASRLKSLLINLDESTEATFRSPFDFTEMKD